MALTPYKSANTKPPPSQELPLFRKMLKPSYSGCWIESGMASVVMDRHVADSRVAVSEALRSRDDKKL
jgi:hypothetical protein